jgi:hypothetical protein
LPIMTSPASRLLKGVAADTTRLESTPRLGTPPDRAQTGTISFDRSNPNANSI